MAGLATGLPHYMEAGSLPCALRHVTAMHSKSWKAAFEFQRPYHCHPHWQRTESHNRSFFI